MQLLTFKQPVRCKKCNTRIYANRSYARWLRKQEERPGVSPAQVDRLSPESLAE